MNSIVIRRADKWDMPQLLKLSPPEVKNPAEFDAYMTLVAEQLSIAASEPECDDQGLLGYCQFIVDPGTRLLTTYSIRLAPHAKGRGVGKMLIEKQREIARAAGAVNHMCVVNPQGEEAMKKLLLSVGLQLAEVYTGQL